MTDRMNVGMLGAYGNDWVGTETFDRLAVGSTVFDQFYTTSLDLPVLYHSLWTGASPARIHRENLDGVPEKRGFPELGRKLRTADGGGIPADLKELGYNTFLITDSPEVAELRDATGFDQVIPLDPPSLEAPAASVEETVLFSRFASVTDAVLEAAKEPEPFLLWVHLSGFGGAWDFPMELREDCVEDEEDPEPYPGGEPPFLPEPVRQRLAPGKKPDRKDSASASLDDTGDPDYDLIRSVVETYAAGMRVWDLSLEMLVDTLRASGLFDSMAILLGSTRGFPLGEHGRVGMPGGADLTGGGMVESPKSPISLESAPSNALPEIPSSLFYSEELHLPLLVHFPNGFGESVRSSAICAPKDIYLALREVAAGRCAACGGSGAFGTTGEFGWTGSSEGTGGTEDVEPGVRDGNGFGKDAKSGTKPNKPKRKPGTLLDLAEENAESIRSRVAMVERDAGSGLRAVATAEWFLVRRPPIASGQSPRVELYLHPNDRWEVNEVADRCAETVGELLPYATPPRTMEDGDPIP